MSLSMQRRLLLLAGFLVLATVAAYGWLRYRGEAELDRSIHAILTERLHLRYAIEERIILDSGPDVDAVWRVSVDAPFDGRILLRAEPSFAIADAADTEHFAKEFSEMFVVDLDGYDLYAAEISLGSGTICPNLKCNVKILLRAADRDLFVRIFKI